MKSIMQQDDGRCYLCELLNQDFSIKNDLEVHHVIFGTSGRKLSTKYGLLTKLCRYHHRESKDAVHQNHDHAALLQDRAQRCFEREYPDLDFMGIFGRNYKIEQEETEGEEHYGFISIIVGGENNYENDCRRDCRDV